MDHTRKIVPLLASDMACESLPLIGTWVAGIDKLNDSYVWATCMRYLNNKYLKVFFFSNLVYYFED